MVLDDALKNGECDGREHMLLIEQININDQT